MRTLEIAKGKYQLPSAPSCIWMELEELGTKVTLVVTTRDLRHGVTPEKSTTGVRVVTACHDQKPVVAF